MRWLIRVTVPFVFLTAAACGPDESPAPGVVEEARGGAAAEPDPVAKPAPEPVGKPVPGAETPPPAPGDAWPGVDDDPSLEQPPGGGDWCGTDARARPVAGWYGPDEQGVWRRASPRVVWRPLNDADQRKKRKAAKEKLRRAKTPEEQAAARLALAALRLDVGTRTEQFGIEHAGVFYASKEGETLPDFLARARKEADARAAQQAGAPAAKPVPTNKAVPK